MLSGAFAEHGLEVPAGLAALPSVIISLCDGLMLQWLADPAGTPSATRFSTHLKRWRRSWRPATSVRSGSWKSGDTESDDHPSGRVQRCDLRVERISTAQVATRNTTAKAARISQ